MLRRALPLLLLVSTTAAAQTTGKSQYAIDRWNTESGLPQNSVNAILQSRDGYLWLATLGGVARFDGTSFTTFSTGDRTGLASDRAFALAQDGAGRIWIGTDNGLSRYEHGRFKTFTVDNGLPDAVVQALAPDAGGSVWFGTRNGALGRADSAGVHVVVPAAGPFGRLVNRLVVDADGAVWVSAATGIWRLDPRSRMPVLVRGRSAHEQGIARDPTDGVWVSTDSGLAHYTRRGARQYRISAQSGLNLADMHALASAPGGALWFATRLGAVWRFAADSGVTQLVLEPARGNTTALLVDREGSVWAGNRVSGLARVRPSLFQVVTTADGLPGDNSAAVFKDSHGRVWDGERCAGAAVSDGTAFRALSPRERLGCVWTFAEDTTGAIWMAGSGVARWRNCHLDSFGAKEGLATNNMRALFVDTRGTLWIGGEHGLVSWDGQHFSRHSGRSQPVEPDVRTILEAHDGAIWVGGDGGLLRYANGDFQAYSTAQGLPSGEVRAIYQDTTGAMWIAIYGGGLARLRGGKIVSLTTADGLVDNFLSSIIEDGAGNLWFSGNRGVFRVSRRELDQRAAGAIDRVHAVAYGRADGMLSAETNGGFQGAVARMADGRFWYPTLEGIAIIDPRSAVSEVPPAVSVERIAVNGQPQEAVDGLRVGPGSADVEITYSGLSLSAPNGVTFRYRLDPWDHDWIDANTRRVASYSRVPPGSYRFRVMAANRDGIWAPEPAPLTFVVQPHVWQTAWFRTLAALAIVALAVVGYRARMRLVRAATERTEREAARQRMTHVLEQQNETLAENLRLKEEVERISRHDLRTPLNSIISLSQIVREGPDLAPQHEASLKLIEQAGYRVLNMANLTLDLFKMEQGTYRLAARPVDLLAVIERALADLQALMRTCEVTCEVTLAETGAPTPAARPWVLGDELLSHSMLTNLIKNAVEASPAGGRVTIVIEQGERVRIRIHNRGAIPEEIRDRFFERYATRGKKGGTGLGTYSAKLMAETQRGTIRAESSAERGTTITVELPRSAPAEPRRAGQAERTVTPAAVALDANAPERTILIIDDDPSSRAILRHYLAHPKWRVDEAENGPLGLRLMAETDYDVAFLDVEMPVLDGFEVAARMRELERNQNMALGRHHRTTIVSVSSHDDEATGPRALAAGCDHYFSKPVARNAILAVVLRHGAAPTTVTAVDEDVQHLVPSFLAAKKVEIGQLRDALARNDQDAVRRTSHRLRGSFSLYGFGDAATLCAELEELARSNQLDHAEARVAALYDYVNRVDVNPAPPQPARETQEA